MSPWRTVDYVERPSIGKFEGDRFDPRKWRPQTPTTAYMELRDDDALWAAQRVAAFTDEIIRAIVHTGEFSDAAAEKALGDILIKRRDRVLRTYLPALNPIVAPRLVTNRLTFENAAVVAGVAEAPESYRAVWSQFDNATGETRPLSETTSTTTSMEVPRGLPGTANSFVVVDRTAESKAYGAWRQPIRTYFRRSTDRWQLVGLERSACRGTPHRIDGIAEAVHDHVLSTGKEHRRARRTFGELLP